LLKGHFITPRLKVLRKAFFAMKREFINFLGYYYIMNPFNLRHLPLNPSFHVKLEGREKSIIVDYPRDKKFVLVTLLIIAVPMSLLLLFISSWKVNGTPSVLNLSTRLLFIALKNSGLKPRESLSFSNLKNPFAYFGLKPRSVRKGVFSVSRTLLHFVCS